MLGWKVKVSPAGGGEAVCVGVGGKVEGGFN